jgi:glycosyltransferase involved in cell wall biosynthesis
MQCLVPFRNPAPDHPEFEIIVVDNAAVHDPPEEIMQMMNVTLVHEPEPGSYTARNKGANLAKGRYLAFTDSDCIPNTDWIKQGKLIFEQTSADLIGGRIDLFRVNGGREWAYIYEKYLAFNQLENVTKGHSVTANLMVTREAFETMGGFDASIKSGGDFEFCERTVAKGYQLVYSHSMAVNHPARENVRSLFKKRKRLAAWGFLNVMKQYGHSGVRIFSSTVYHGFRAIFKRSSKPDEIYHRFVVFWIASGLYLYTILLQLMYVLQLADPEKIRE